MRRSGEPRQLRANSLARPAVRGRLGGIVMLRCTVAEGPMTEKRKLAAILCSDVVGYSAHHNCRYR